MPIAVRKRFIRRTIAPIRLLCYVLPGSGALFLALPRYADVFSIRFHAIHSLLVAAAWGITWGALRLFEHISPWFLSVLAREARFVFNIWFLILWACLLPNAFYGGRSVDIPLLRWVAGRLARKHPERAPAAGGNLA
jgi:uncharacterized membrane protein